MTFEEWFQGPAADAAHAWWNGLSDEDRITLLMEEGDGQARWDDDDE